MSACPDCSHAKHEHERPYGCARCACENGYWGGDEEDAPADLAAFLLARYDEEEFVARSIVDPLPLANDALHSMSQGPDPDHKVAVIVSPARVLAECEAKRRRVRALGDRAPHPNAVPLVRKLLALEALPYASHPDFREAWRP